MMSRVPTLNKDLTGNHRAVIAVVQRGEFFLAIKRAKGIRAAGKICFPGGMIEAGEDHPTALRRELAEELGVQSGVGELLFECATPWGTELNFYAVHIADVSAIKPNPDEVASVMWLTGMQMIEHPDLLLSNLRFLQNFVNE